MAKSKAATGSCRAAVTSFGFRLMRSAVLAVALFFVMGQVVQFLFPLAIAQAQMQPLFDDATPETAPHQP